MTTDEIIKSLDSMIKELGAAANVRGLADEVIGMGNYKNIMARYQVMLHNLMRVTQEQAKQLKALEEAVAKGNLTKDQAPNDGTVNKGQSQIG